MSAGAATPGMTLFATAIGRCGVAWRGDTIVATHLPEPDDALTLTRLSLRLGEAREATPPAPIGRAMAAITDLLAQGCADLSFIACDFGDIEPFRIKVYDIARAIPPGQVLTYGEIALRIGDRHFAQAVGQALGRNPLPIIVPCHRVIGANGKLTGFSANGGTATKLRMLAIEGAQPGHAPSLFDALPLAAKPRR